MKLSLTLNVSKINKDKIFERKYKNKDGVEVVDKIYKIEVVPLKEKKMVAQGDNWVMYKTHFVVESQTKEEKANKTPSNYVGEGMEFESKSNPILDSDGRDLTPSDNNPF